MSEARHTLDELQRWMQAVVTHPSGVTGGIESPQARAQIAIVPEQALRVVTRSRALSALERLEIYNRAYFARLLECLREEYSVLAAALGSDLFDEFAVAYLSAHPPESYTLGKLGAKFAEYLSQSRPRGSAAKEEVADWP
ncbi:MAG TPA: DNA-binding domain-containing protein, partial [Planctomycetaceae bacterium]|nr:DNA-binding domain-containing protein [Planctomycetaceae bacterium]